MDNCVRATNTCTSNGIRGNPQQRSDAEPQSEDGLGCHDLTAQCLLADEVSRSTGYSRGSSPGKLHEPSVDGFPVVLALRLGGRALLGIVSGALVGVGFRGMNASVHRHGFCKTAAFAWAFMLAGPDKSNREVLVLECYVLVIDRGSGDISIQGQTSNHGPPSFTRICNS